MIAERLHMHPRASRAAWLCLLCWLCCAACQAAAGFDDFAERRFVQLGPDACKDLDDPVHEYRFGSGSIDDWQGEAGDESIQLANDASQGLAQRGALRVQRTLITNGTEPDTARVRVELGPAQPIGCISAMIKIRGEPGLDERLRREAAAWIVYAMSGDEWCWAQADTPTAYHAKLDHADLWFHLGVSTVEPKLSSDSCTFDPSQVVAVGIGIASYHDEPWDATFYVDDVKLF